MGRVAAVVVTYNRKGLLLECIAQLLAQEGLAEYGVSLHVLVVDNASTDGTGEALASLSDPRIASTITPAPTWEVRAVSTSACGRRWRRGMITFG